MISTETIRQNLDNTLKETSFKIGKLYRGKVRDNYSLGPDSAGKQVKRIIIVSDRISCFDKVVGTLPFKGQVLNQIALFWFNKTKHIATNHIIDNPDPNVSVVKGCVPLPVEMVVRGYLTGSLWRAYEKGERELYGITLPDMLKKDEKFKEPIITPTTKAELGKHDEPISRKEIIEQGLIKKEIYEEMEKISYSLFKFATDFMHKNNLILVDTKYEFGICEGKLILIDEIHTPDSSRFWYENEYEKRFRNNMDQKMIDKEYVRQWLISKKWMGDGRQPELSDEVRIEATRRYIEAFEMITGKEFIFENKNILKRIESNLKLKGYLN